MLKFPLATILCFVVAAWMAGKVAQASGSGAVVYITDLEGKGAKWAEFLHENPAFSRDSNGELRLNDGFTFVYGGDTVDRGPNSMQIVSELLKLKKRYPERVVLIAGNRDINKIRIGAELVSGPVPREFQLKQSLEKTMGAPKAFEFRREELGARAGVSPTQISDVQVLASYEKDLAPGGDLYEYLSHAQLAYRHGDTLFVHGAVTDESLGMLPNRSDRIEDLGEWVNELNRWYAGQIEEWRQGHAPGPGLRPGEELIRYQSPIPGTKSNQRSVVYGRYSDSTGNPRLPDEETIERLRKSGIHRIVVGHTPNGDSPTILRTRHFEIIIADNTESPHGTTLAIDGARVTLKAKTRLAPQTDSQAPWHDIHMSWKLDQPTLLGLRPHGDETLIKGVTTDHKIVASKVGKGFEVEQFELPATGFSREAVLAGCIENAIQGSLRERGTLKPDQSGSF